jgi:hypothetical protein
LTRDFIKHNRTPNWDEYPKIKDHRKSFVEYKKSETFAQKSAQVKNSASKKGEYHRLGRGGYAAAIPKWREMEQDLIAKGIISAVFHWPERLQNWYYAHGGRLNPDDGTLEFPPTLREKALELMDKIEDVKAGRLKVHREMDELTMALGIQNTQDVAGATGWLLTPKFGTIRGLICGPSLVKKSIRKKEGFSRKIRQRSSRSAVGFRSARKLFVLILRDCVMTWPERKGRMDG